LRVHGPNVDQIEVSGLSGVRLTPDPARTPSVAGSPFSLPALIPLDLGQFAGALTLRVRGLVASTEVGAAQASTTLALREHRRLDVDLLRSGDGSISDGSFSDGASAPDGSGGSWELLTSNTSEDLLAIWALAPDDLIVVGGNSNAGIVLRGSDQNWIAQTLGQYLLTDVWASARDNIYATSAETVVWRFDGAAWSKGARLGGVLNGIAGTSESNLYVVGSQTISNLLQPRANFWQSAFGGESGALNQFRGVWASTAGPVYVGGLRTPSLSPAWGMIRAGSGVDWPLVDEPQPPVNALWGTDTQNVYAVGSSSLIRHLTSGGWVDEASPVPVNLWGVWGTSADVYAVGDDGTILHRDPGGAWQREPAPVSTHLRAVIGVGGVMYAVGHGGVILRKL
jgi:hypothetical protein